MLTLSTSSNYSVTVILPDYVYDIVFLYLSCIQDHADIGTGTRQSHLHGVSFPIQPEAVEALKQFQQGSLGYLQLVKLPFPNPTTHTLHSHPYTHT